MNRLELRGVKRRCQSDQCGLPFYDLNRTEIACPNCGAAFVVVTVQPVAARTPWRMGGRPGPARRVELPIEQAADPIDEIVAEDAVEDAIEAATDSEVLLETDTDEASEPIEANPERTADE